MHSAESSHAGGSRMQSAKMSDQPARVRTRTRVRALMRKFSKEHWGTGKAGQYEAPYNDEAGQT